MEGKEDMYMYMYLLCVVKITIRANSGESTSHEILKEEIHSHTEKTMKKRRRRRRKRGDEEK